MHPLTADYRLSACEVKTLENKLIATGMLNYIDNDAIEIVAKVGKLPVTEYGTRVKVNIYNSRLGFRALVGTVYTSSFRFLRIIELDTLVDYERRHFFRVDVHSKAYVILESDYKKSQETQEDPPEVEIMVHNISLSGVLFDSKEELKAGARYLLRLRLNHRVCLFPFEVKRVSDPESDQEWTYGCPFGSVSSPDTDALCAFIFEQQQEYIKRQQAGE